MSQNIKSLRVFGIPGCIVLFLSFIKIVTSLECYQCNSWDNTSNRTEALRIVKTCKNLEHDEEIKELFLKPCKEKEDRANETKEERTPVCITLEYQVHVKYSWKAGEQEYSKVMKDPSYRRMCGFARKDSPEIDNCVTRGGATTKFAQCTCTTSACNDKPFGSTSYLWIYLVTIFITLVVATSVSYTVYRKTGCNFDK